MSFIRKIFICIALFFTSTVGVFAQENNSNTISETQKTINNYILEVYKFQGNKIIADLETNLDKVAPTKNSKIEAYSSIQLTLKQKKESIEKDTKTGENAKKILTNYLNFLITEIEKKKKELK